MNPRLLSFAFILSATLAAPAANATTVALNFPTSAATYVGQDQGKPLGAGGTSQETQIGDGISQTFTATGLSSATEAFFNGITVINRTTFGTQFDFDVLLNGSRIGNFGYVSLGENDDFQFSGGHAIFLPVAALAGETFTISLVSTKDVLATGQGFWDFLPGGTVTLVGVEAAVPEPSTWAMMILGFAGIGFLAYRRRSAGLRLA